MGGLCNCIISNPNEIITLDLEIENEKRRAMRRSLLSLEDMTSDIKKQEKAIKANNNEGFNGTIDQVHPDEQSNKGLYKQNSLESTRNQRDISFALLRELNTARSNPSLYSEKVFKYSNYIKSSNKGECYFEFNKQRIILNQDPHVFTECIEYLKEKDPIPTLQMTSDLLINVPDDQINECDKPNYINKVISLKKEELKHKYTTIEFQMNKNINNPELSAIMQIIDPNDPNQSNRNNIFNSRFSHVGINCFEIDDNIFCYYILFGEVNKNYEDDF